jgi:DEAD/DEAH box helicase domain-containing protein
LHDRRTKALYLYPTKALANDQAAALGELLKDLPVSAAVYQGDTPEHERAKLRLSPPNILISNPDTLHHNQLARHADWAQWWRELRYVVVDEAHTYRGVFGAHVGHVMRRLRRLASYYGADPLFIAATATIGNPAEHLQALTGRTPVVIDQDGAPHTGSDFIIWRPNALSEIEAARFLTAAVRLHLQVIGFARSRMTAERIRRLVRTELTRSGHGDLDASVAAYRAGYLPERRRAIERGLRNGSVRAVISTNALELGIDIGTLEVAVLSTYPGSTMAFRQQAGRAGRRDRRIVIMIVGENPLDEYIAEHPDWAISAGAEDAVIDPANEIVVRGQLSCAARELALSTQDHELYGDNVWSQIDDLVKEGRLTAKGGALGPGTRAFRPRDVNLRSIEGHPFDLMLGSRRVGDIDAQYVTMEAYPGAVYLQEGDPYRVVELDPQTRVVRLENGPENVLTRPLGERYVNVREVSAERHAVGGRLTVRLCRLHVRSRVAAYQEFDEKSRAPLGRPIQISPVTQDLNTEGLEIECSGRGPGLHAVEHLIRALAPIAVLCDRADVDGHTDIDGRVSGAAYVFDRTAGGSGLSRKLFDHIDDVLADATKRLSACGCREGCPLCIHIGNCMLRNEQLSKEEAAAVLGATLAPVAVRHRRQQKAADERSPKRACPSCGRVFAESSWAKGYPRGRHNRVKGDPSSGVCRGALESSTDTVAASSRTAHQFSNADRREMVLRTGSVSTEGASAALARLKAWRNRVAPPSIKHRPEIGDRVLEKIALRVPVNIDDLREVLSPSAFQEFSPAILTTANGLEDEAERDIGPRRAPNLSSKPKRR